MCKDFTKYGLIIISEIELKQIRNFQMVHSLKLSSNILKCISKLLVYKTGTCREISKDSNCSL